MNSRTLLMVFFIFGFGLILQTSFFTPPSKTQTPYLNPSPNPKSVPPPSRNQKSNRALHSGQSHKDPPVLNRIHPPQYQRILRPQNWMIKTSQEHSLSALVLGYLIKELDWPKTLSFHHLYPRKIVRWHPPHPREIFFDYAIKIQGFQVSESYLRVMLFEKTPGLYQIIFVDQNLEIPPPMEFSILVSKAAAEKKTAKNFSKRPVLWRNTPEWIRQKGAWSPGWKIQWQGSEQTYFVHAITGDIQSTTSKLQAQKPLPIWGRYTPLLGLEQELSWNILEGMPPLEMTSPSRQTPLMQAIPLTSSFVDVRDANSNSSELMATYRLLNQTRLPIWSLNTQGTAKETALLNSYVYVQKAYRFMQSYLLQSNFLQSNNLQNNRPFDSPLLNQPVQVQANRKQESCNANYSNGVLSFFRATEECRNTAYDTIIFHEYGHYLDDLYGGIRNPMLSEALGDILATLITQQPLIGQELFRQNHEPLRNAHNSTRYQYQEDSINSVSVAFLDYSNAEAFSGFAWRVRNALISQIGETAGQAMACWLFLGLFETNPANIESAVEEIFAREGMGFELGHSPYYELLSKAAHVHNLKLHNLRPALDIDRPIIKNKSDGLARYE